MKNILADSTVPIFHIVAPANSPIWGTAEDMENWLRAWHEQGELISSVISTITPELTFDVLADLQIGVSLFTLVKRYNVPVRIVKYIIGQDQQKQEQENDNG